MPDWTRSMTQSFEFYIVDPNTWTDDAELKTVKSCTITRDLSTETLGSATFEVDDILDECYVRVYMITIQDGVRERHPMGTFLIQTPSSKFNGRVKSSSIDAYTPLIELKENPPPIGYFVAKDSNIMSSAYTIARERARAPISRVLHDKTLHRDFISNTNDTWLSYLRDLISDVKYTFDLDEMGRILFAPKQDIASLQPVWTYNDGNSSILYPSVSTSYDLYEVPNTVEVIYSNGYDNYYHKIVNDDPNSPTSTVNRGREILRRVTDLGLSGIPTNQQVEEMAKQLLRELSTIEYTITYSHAYCPVRLGDCIRLNYSKADLIDIKGKVIRQSIKCVPRCPVTETAIYTSKLWG